MSSEHVLGHFSYKVTLASSLMLCGWLADWAGGRGYLTTWLTHCLSAPSACRARRYCVATRERASMR